MLRAIKKGDLDSFKKVVSFLNEKSLLQHLTIEDIKLVLKSWGVESEKYFPKEIKNGIYHAVKCLLDNGVSVKGSNLIPFCIRENSVNCSIKLMELLHQNGADLNGVYEGETGLMYACSNYGSLGKIKFFLDNYADVDVLDLQHKNALIIFCSSHGAKFNMECDEVKADYITLAKQLIERTTNLKTKDNDGNSAVNILQNRLNQNWITEGEKYDDIWLIEQISKEQERRKDKIN